MFFLCSFGVHLLLGPTIPRKFVEGLSFFFTVLPCTSLHRGHFCEMSLGTSSKKVRKPCFVLWVCGRHPINKYVLSHPCRFVTLIHFKVILNCCVSTAAMTFQMIHCRSRLVGSIPQVISWTDPAKAWVLSTSSCQWLVTWTPPARSPLPTELTLQKSSPSVSKVPLGGRGEEEEVADLCLLTGGLFFLMLWFFPIKSKS